MKQSNLILALLLQGQKGRKLNHINTEASNLLKLII